MENVYKIESPDFVQTSLAGAMSLGLEPGSFYRNAYPKSLNLLLTYQEGCRANCSYCGLARERHAEAGKDTFIRVKWQTYELAKIISILVQPAADVAAKVQRFGRICVSMVTQPQAEKDCLAVVQKLKSAVNLPLSVLISPSVLPNATAFLKQLKLMGAERVGIAVDAATPELFAKLRGQAVGGPHRWDNYWSAVEKAVQVFGYNYVTIHLVVGLGETEHDMAEAIVKANKYGAQAHLFSFCPEPGSAMGNDAPPSLGQYRRIQLAAYLLNNKIVPFDEFVFDTSGKIVSYGRPLTELLGDNFAKGKPFMTSGCPQRDGCVACNRPYGNERPGAVLRNYPFLPEEHDLDNIKGQIWND